MARNADASMTPPRPVIFDLDGTLLDTLLDIANAANDCLVEEGAPIHTPDAYRFFVGEGVQVLMGRVLPEDRRDAETIARCVARFGQAYERRWREHSAPYPRVERLLDELRSRDAPTAVLSNKPQDFTRKCTDFFFPGYPFRVVFGARPGVPRKPAPDGATEIGHILGTEPNKIVYVGDSSVDMRTAVAAGMFPVGVSWGFRPRMELIAAGAAVIIDDPLELPAILERPLSDRSSGQ